MFDVGVRCVGVSLGSMGYAWPLNANSRRVCSICSRWSNDAMIAGIPGEAEG